MDPRQLRDNNWRLAAELNKAKLDMREMHDHAEKERKDLQDEIVRLRQLAGKIGQLIFLYCKDFAVVPRFWQKPLLSSEIVVASADWKNWMSETNGRDNEICNY